MDEHLPPEHGAARSPAGRLDSWKEIAAYLGRGIRTVQRWERDEGLPVHRLAHEKRGTVYAYHDELAVWWAERRAELEATGADDDVAAPADAPDRLTRAPARPTRRWPTAAVSGVLLASVVVVLAWRAWTHTEPAAPRVSRVTDTAAVTFWPALSPDGRLLAYTSDAASDDAVPQVWVQQIGGAAMRLTSGPRSCFEPSFSADGTRVAYTALGEDGHALYEVPTLGGEPRLVRWRAVAGRYSPDGRHLSFVALDDPGGLVIAASDGTNPRPAARSLLGVRYAVWSPDGAKLLAYGRDLAEAEPDWWVVPVDGQTPFNTRLIERLRGGGFISSRFQELPPAWLAPSALVFSGRTTDGMNVWRQRFAPATFEPVGSPERLTRGTDMAWGVAVAGQTVAFVSSHPDMNLWSVPVDPETGTADGSPSRLTRGPSTLGFLSASRDGRWLAYSSERTGDGDVFVRDLASGAERVVAGGPLAESYSALSPSGAQVAYGLIMPGTRATRPVVVVDTARLSTRGVCDDCGGRPRQWLDERFVILERFGPRLNSIALLDTVTGAQREVLANDEQSIANPSVAPDGAWIAFDAARPGDLPSVFVARLNRELPVPERTWVEVQRAASHPFWSADGRRLNFLTGANRTLRDTVKARRFNQTMGQPEDETFLVHHLSEYRVPTWLTGTTPVATADEIILVLSSFRGDVWMLELGADERSPRQTP